MYYIGDVIAEGWTPWSRSASYMFPFHSEMLTFDPRQALDRVKTEGDAAEDVNVQMSRELEQAASSANHCRVSTMEITRNRLVQYTQILT